MTSSVLTQTVIPTKKTDLAPTINVYILFHNFRLEKEEEEQWEVSSYSFIIALYFVNNNSDRAL